jgi:hypothetical protein
MTRICAAGGPLAAPAVATVPVVAQARPSQRWVVMEEWMAGEKALASLVGHAALQSGGQR